MFYCCDCGERHCTINIVHRVTAGMFTISYSCAVIVPIIAGVLWDTTGIAVAHGRGVLLLACYKSGVQIFEYTPMQIKLAVTGDGHADKRAVQSMVKLLLSLKSVPKPDDAADALAAAICHGCTMGPAAEEFRIR